MTKGDGKPCIRCGTSEWTSNSTCKQCNRKRAANWRKDNHEKRLEQKRRYRKRHPEKVRADSKEWEQANPDKVAARYHRRRTRKTEAGGGYTAAEWKALCKQYGGRCACCGKKTKLAADHVVPVVAGGSSNISNIQPLCKSCNSIKGTKAIDYRTKPGILRWVQRELFDKL